MANALGPVGQNTYGTPSIQPERQLSKTDKKTQGIFQSSPRNEPSETDRLKKAIKPLSHEETIARARAIFEQPEKPSEEDLQWLEREASQAPAQSHFFNGVKCYKEGTRESLRKAIDDFSLATHHENSEAMKLLEETLISLLCKNIKNAKNLYSQTMPAFHNICAQLAKERFYQSMEAFELLLKPIDEEGSSSHNQEVQELLQKRLDNSGTLIAKFTEAIKKEQSLLFDLNLIYRRHKNKPIRASIRRVIPDKAERKTKTNEWIHKAAKKIEG